MCNPKPSKMGARLMINLKPPIDGLDIGSASLEVIALKPLAIAALGRTGADIERLIREARQKVRRQNRQLTYSDISDAFNTRKEVMSPELLWRIAVHESGHVLAWAGFDVGSVQTVSVGNGLGGFVDSKIKKGVIQNEEWLNKILACTLAGHAAEMLIFGDATIGSGGNDQSDLARATKLALDAETSLGLGETHPLLYRPFNDQTLILSHDRQLAQQVHTRLEVAEGMATDLLSKHQDALLLLAKRLALAKTLDGDEVHELLGSSLEMISAKP
jgi:ATP-dependent Zn protease